MNRSSDGQRSAVVDNELMPSIYEHSLVTPLPRVLGEVQKHFVEHCRRLLKRGLQDAEEQLREWAIRNPDELRLGSVRRAYAERNNILNAFSECLAHGFAVVLDAGEVVESSGHTAAASTADGVDARQVPLVLEQAAAQTRAADCRLLDSIVERLNYLLYGRTASQSTSPVEPIRVAKCLLTALAGRLDLPYKAKEVLFLKFRSHVLDELGACYKEVDTLLVDAQILPGLGDPESKAQGRFKPVRFPQVNVHLTQAKEFDETGPGGGLSTSTIAELLPIILAPAQSQERRDSLQEILSQLTVGWGEHPWLGQSTVLARDQVITLCAALFDEVLNDSKMPSAATAIVGRLALPYARFALFQSSEFLVQPVHPARKLLSSLQMLGCTLGDLDSGESRSTYHLMMRTVGEIGAHRSLTDDHFIQTYRNLLSSIN